MVKLTINNKEYKVKIANTEEEREQGYQGVTEVPDDEGILFVFDEPDTQSFWMHNTPVNLDIVFINEDDTVIKVATGYADTEDAHTAEDCLYVLEVAQGSGIMIGDKIEVDDTVESDSDEEEEEEEIDDVEESEQLMMVLNAKGESQMDLRGGERIFSRKNTKSLLKFAKRAYTTKSTASYKTLGNKVFSFMDAQDERGNEYIEAPE